MLIEKNNFFLQFQGECKPPSLFSLQNPVWAGGCTRDLGPEISLDPPMPLSLKWGYPNTTHRIGSINSYIRVQLIINMRKEATISCSLLPAASLVSFSPPVVWMLCISF